MKKWSWKALALALAVMTIIAAGTVQAAVKSGWDGSSYYKNGKKVTGLVTINKKQYFFNTKGTLIKDRVAYPITVDGKKQYFDIDTKGVAVQWTGVYEMAAKNLYDIKAVTSTMKTTTKYRGAALKKAFLWSAKLKFVNMAEKKLTATKAMEYYGKLGFAQKKGDCTAQASTFALMARVLRYDSALVRGYVPKAVTAAGKYTNFQSHAWVEINYGKATYGFDPNFNTSSDAKQVTKVVYGDKKTKGYHFSYGDKGVYKYHNAKKRLIK